MSTPALQARSGLHLGTVTDNVDPEGRGRVRVRLTALEVEIWAPVATHSAGNGYGVAVLPRVGEVSVVAFVGTDVPVILGSVWSGSSSFPTDGEPVEERYCVRTPAGLVATFDDSGTPKVSLATPSGNKVTLNDGADGLAVEVAGTSVLVKGSEVSVTSSGPVKIEASQVEVSAGMVQVDAGMAKFSGVVKCSTLIADSVVGTSYTPGAGNIW